MRRRLACRQEVVSRAATAGEMTVASVVLAEVRKCRCSRSSEEGEMSGGAPAAEEVADTGGADLLVCGRCSRESSNKHWMALKSFSTLAKSFSDSGGISLVLSLLLSSSFIEGCSGGG